MAVYVVQGHPLNIASLGLANADVVRAALQMNGIGTTVTLSLTGPDDATVKNHGVLK